MSKNCYIHPILEQEFAKIPEGIRHEIDLYFDIVVRINEILERRGWCQADLARVMGKKEPEISKWLSGKHNFTIQTIAKIETALGEDIISVKKYRKSRKPYNYDLYGQKGNWLNEPEEPGYNK